MVPSIPATIGRCASDRRESLGALRGCGTFEELPFLCAGWRRCERWRWHQDARDFGFYRPIGKLAGEGMTGSGDTPEGGGEVMQDIVVADPEDAEAARHEDTIPLGILERLCCVDWTVDLEH
jgi:hypothetical protein